MDETQIDSPTDAPNEDFVEETEESQPLPVSYRTHQGAPVNDTYRIQ